MYDHHRDFFRRNFMDPQQVWNRMVSWCWDAALHRRPCLVHTCHLFDFKCLSSPHEINRIIHMLDILHVLSVLLVQGIAGKWQESCLRFPSWISHPYKTINQIFLWQILCRIFATLLETKLIETIPCWMITCIWRHQACCNPWARVTIQNRFWQN